MIVVGWEKWQTFRKDRGAPPWIKLYRNLLTNTEWVMLTDAEKGQLVSIWIVAAERDGTVPDNPVVLRKVCLLDDTPNVEKFVELGFLAERCQPSGDQAVTVKPKSDAPEKSREEKSRVEKKRGTFKNVCLNDEEYKKLKIKFNSSTDSRIDTLSEYMRSKGKRYKSHYATILTWARNDKASEPENQFAGIK